MKLEKLFYHEAVKKLRDSGGFVSNSQYPLFAFYIKDMNVMNIGDTRARQFLFNEYFTLVDQNWAWESEDNKDYILTSEELMKMVEDLVSDLKEADKLLIIGKLATIRTRLKVKEKGSL